MSVGIDEIYEALTYLIENTIVEPPGGTFYKIKERSLVVPLGSMEADREKWGAVFRDKLRTGNKIRAWFFTKVDDHFESADRKSQRDYIPEHVLQVHFFMGKESGNSVNSDLNFQREADAVVSALNRNPRLMPEALSRMRPFKLRRNYRPLGQESTHFAVGFLYVQGC